MRSVAAIVNPVAGRGAGMRRWNRMRRRLAARGILSETFVSSSPVDATALARRCVASGFETIVVVGGDGTIHEVVNGLRREVLAGVRLAILPAGTGMDFARNLGLRRGIEAAVDRVLRDRPQPVDLGLAHGEEEVVFVNFAEVGLGAAVVAREAAMNSRLPGRSSFLLAALAAALDQQGVHARITVDGAAVYDGSLVSAIVANGPYFGGGMKIAPRASVDDGRFDIVLLGDFTRAELVTQIWKVYPGIHLRHPKVHWMRGSEVSVVPSSPARLDLDGELYSHPARSFTILAGALQVLV